MEGLRPNISRNGEHPVDVCTDVRWHRGLMVSTVPIIFLVDICSQELEK